MFKQVKLLLNNYKQYNIDDKKKTSLDIILSNAHTQRSQEERIEWIQQLFKWIRSDSYFEHDEKIPVVKIKFLLMLLERNKNWQEDVRKIFKETLTELSAIEFFCEVGLPNQIDFIGELGEKIMDKILPRRPIDNQLGEFLLVLFPDREDAEWIESIDEDTLEQIFNIFQTNENISFPHLQNDIEEALIYLVSQIVAIGLSPLVRKRIPHTQMKTLPFFSLPVKLSFYLKIKNETLKNGNEVNKELKNILYAELINILQDTARAVKEVYFHLDKYGVSVHLVYQLERLNHYLSRTNALLEINHSDIIAKDKIAYFTADLIKQSLIQRSIKSLISGNVTLLAQKIVERNSKMGEHYIAQDIHEYWAMFKSAVGGGLITAFTVYIKNSIITLPFTRFIIGAFGSLNYAGSFLLIQFAGFTLGTKQPAATATALAQKLESLEKIEQVEKVTDEIVMVSRTQFVAVIGNIIAVIPVVLLINFIYHYATHRWIINAHSAEHNLHSTDLLGPAIIYAVFTGFLLWLSSVASGWTENWFAFNDLHYLLANNKKCKLLLGNAGAKKLAYFLEHNISGIAANISLGLLLGLAPEFLAFVGIPLEVRHVTLSTGSIAASIPTLGFGVFQTVVFWRCIAGLMVVGFINIFVSFALAFFVAVRAKKISSRKRRLIYRSVLKRFAQRPISFFIPSKSSP
ncbi:MAG: hypothetical protein PHY93_12810 [Bacteriovorax sp.]|nr:hypothetical protein [Bacteriovorax sp.]